MNKVAVLGSSGQIGGHLVDYLRQKDIEVDGYSISSHKTATNIVCDLSRENLDFSKYDFVYFLAFDVGGSRYLKTYQHTSRFMNNNMRLMSNVFEELEKTKVPFIFTSSQMANMSYSPYGLLKHLGELNTAALNGLVVKFWNIYGIEHDLEKAHVITDFILKAKNGMIDMMTTGEEVRQFLYADDCCECLDILAEKYAEIDREKPLHVTNFENTSIMEVAKIISEYVPSRIVPGKLTDSVQQDARNEPDPYIKKYWTSKTSLQEGIKKVVESME